MTDSLCPDMSAVDILKATQQRTEPVRRQCRYGCIFAPPANMIESSMCCGDAAFCQITLTTCRLFYIFCRTDITRGTCFASIATESSTLVLALVNVGRHLLVNHLLDRLQSHLNSTARLVFSAECPTAHQDQPCSLRIAGSGYRVPGRTWFLDLPRT